ncbi:hypothetical protein J7384_17195 [Endozoicomonas sp. G2_1]|uniref:hypothetical protein n=1 Tax=Endozoicomonas sp. G2_1 TaxID=2821091 RepID=UPI001ADA32AE|nr:hypothetical protein [Endozoicomonas sp. G2_1]MBO9492101.1 hypothetical protein [Endozoicomonas sp. G2_1]
MNDIIDFTAKAKETVMTPVSKFTGGCPHTKIDLDEHRRVIECTECRKIFEPFDYLLKWANGQQRIIWKITAAKHEAESLNNQIKELKRQKRNLQAQVNRLKKKVILE